MSQLPVVWIILVFKNAFGKKLNFSQDFWWSFLREKLKIVSLFYRLTYFYTLSVMSQRIKKEKLYLNATGHIYRFPLTR